ncbi:MAG: ATP-binding cassette domain-containing protein, partial [Thioalkalispiraceae bacterium]
IYIDDQDISKVTFDSLYQNISLIPQEVTLFNRSIMENIRYARLNATDKEVMEAAKKAHIHEFIYSLDSQYDTEIGGHGITLSTGQKQRIAISRAFLKDAPILILDEPTSSLDSITETNLQHSLTRLMENKTVISIAHRLSTLLEMDRIFVFENGRIAGDATHKELLASNPLYKSLWESQSQGYIHANHAE